MTSPTEDPSGIRVIAEGLLTTFENLGAEHQALAAEEKETTTKERLGTVRRMRDAIEEATRILVHSTHLLATVHGMRALGINSQRAKDADGHSYSPLLSLGDPAETLYETATYLQVVVQSLDDKVYAPTRKYPALATARRPQQMKKVLTGLRTALTGLCTELIACGHVVDTSEFNPAIARLNELEARVLRVVPAQAAGPTLDDVIAAIRSDPKIAQAAAAALERTDA